MVAGSSPCDLVTPLCSCSSVSRGTRSLRRLSSTDCSDVVFDQVECIVRHANFRRDVDGIGAQLGECSPKVLFRLAIAIPGGCVEPVDSDFNRTSDCRELRRSVRAGHESRDRPSAKGDGGDSNSCPPKSAVVHGFSSSPANARMMALLSHSPSPHDASFARSDSCI